MTCLSTKLMNRLAVLLRTSLLFGELNYIMLRLLFSLRFWMSFLQFNDTQGKNCTLQNSVQKFIEIHGWLLLTIFIRLHNQLSSFNSIIVQMSEKRDSSNRQ